MATWDELKDWVAKIGALTDTIDVEPDDRLVVIVHPDRWEQIKDYVHVNNERMIIMPNKHIAVDKAYILKKSLLDMPKAIIDVPLKMESRCAEHDNVEPCFRCVLEGTRP